MRSPLRPLALLAPVLAAAAALALPANARADDGVAYEANTGLQTGIGPVLLVPSDGPMGGGLDLDIRYGIGAGPVVIGPGARFAGYVLSRHLIGMGMPTLRLTLPLGPFAPFAVGGAGFGYLSNDDETGVALMGGGGLMIHLGPFLAIGAEATYQTITKTDFKTLTIGPSLQIGF